MALTPRISGPAGARRGLLWCVPDRVVAVTVVVAAALVLVACGPAPTPSGAATDQASVDVEPSGSSTPSTSPIAGLPIDDSAYLAGDVFAVAVGDAGSDWAAPSTMPVMPNGQRAVRVAFLPASCETDVIIETGPLPEDPWETDLRANVEGYSTMFWPAAQVPECADGDGRTYLEVGYHPVTVLDSVHLVAAVPTVDGAPTEVQVVPVFTSADASQPALTSSGFIALGPVTGPEEPRSAEPTELSSETFVGSTLPDGSVPTHWSYTLTGCGGDATEPMVVSLRVGTDAPIEVGTCSEGSATSNDLSLPLPAEGTRIAVLLAGGTTHSQVRVSLFEWRGERD